MAMIAAIRSRLGDALAAGPVGRGKRVVVGLVREIRDDDVLGLSGELAYRWLLAIFPLVIMIAAMAGFVAGSLGVDDPTDDLIDAAGSALPPEAAATIRPQLERILDNQDGALFSLGLLLTVYAASSGMKALIKGLNRAYDVEETRPFWRQILIALALTVLLGTAAVVSFIVMVTGQVAATEVASAIGLAEAAAWLVEVAPFPLAILALGVASTFLYWAAPARHPHWRWVLPGVVVVRAGMDHRDRVVLVLCGQLRLVRRHLRSARRGHHPAPLALPHRLHPAHRRGAQCGARTRVRIRAGADA
jgi:membrane protein